MTDKDKEMFELRKEMFELKEKDKQIEALIEKMKCCNNCAYFDDTGEGFVSQKCRDCDCKSNWKLKE